MNIRPRALVLGALCAAFLAVAIPGLVLHGFSRAASLEIQKRPGLGPADHNGLKHAYAAAEVYSLARLVLGPERAAAAVITLGEWNERAETYVKPSTDWSPEVYKDLRNNLTGVAAAEWLYGEAGFTSPFTRLSLIGKLAEDKVTLALHTDPRIPDLPQRPDYERAIERMRQDEPRLLDELRAEITARGPELKAELGLSQP